MTETPPTTPDQGDERRAEAYIAAHDAFNSALPAGLRGHSEWCDRFDAARAAFDRAFVMSHPEYGVQKRPIGDCRDCREKRLPCDYGCVGV